MYASSYESSWILLVQLFPSNFSLYFFISFSVTCLLVANVSIYWYYKNKYNYWLNRKIDGPKPQFPNGNAYDNEHSTVKLVKWKELYGKIYGIYNGFQPVLVIEEPEILKDILVTNFNKFSDRRLMTGHHYTKHDLVNQNGVNWKKDRSIISPTFSSGKIKLMFPLICQAYDCLDEELKTRIDLSEDQVDMKSIFSKFTAMVVSKCAFASYFNVFSNPDNELFKQMQSIFKKNRKRFILNTILPSFMRKFFSFSPINPDAINYIGVVCKEIIRQRKQMMDNSRTDLLQLLIEANEVEGDNFPEVKVIANSILFFIAGSETTSTLLTWANYNLAMNQHTQEKLFDEISQVKNNNGQLDYETLFQLKYLDSVINETLRLFPPVPSYERVATSNHTLPNGLIVEKGIVIRIPVYTLHRSKENYINPQIFDPERFMPNNKDQLKPYTFLPFVTGPRNCVGMRFALLVAKLTLFKLFSKYKIVKCNDTPEKIDFKKNSFILEVEKFHLKLEKRF